jgi:3-oxoacyl-[acyl-carrier-protein] synthase II
LPGAAVVGYALRTAAGSSVSSVVDRWMRANIDQRSALGVWANYPAAAHGIGRIVDGPVKSPHDRILRRMALHGHAVAVEALQDSGLAADERMGIYVGIGGLRAQWDDLIPALRNQDPDFVDGWQRGLKQLHPFWMLQHLSNNTHALLSKDLGARGEGFTFGGSNAGAQALESAIVGLASGANDAALVVVYDSMLEPELMLGSSELSFPSEAAAAIVLQRCEVTYARSVVSARTAADGEDGLPAYETASQMAALFDASMHLDAPRPMFGHADSDIVATLGNLGAATSVVQAILWTERLSNDIAYAAALCLAVGSPGLAGAVRVSRP